MSEVKEEEMKRRREKRRRLSLAGETS